MDIKKTKNGNQLTVALTGRLDTTTAPELEEALKDALPGTQELIFDFANLEYVSSAGLRVLLATQKTMNEQGKMFVENVCSDIMEVFQITGFIDILTVR